MRNANTRLAVAAAAIYAVFGAFMFLSVADESTILGGVRVSASAATPTTGGVGLPGLVDQAARGANAVVVHEVNDLHDRLTRHLYVASGGIDTAEARWLADGYPSFSPKVTREIHPASELDGVDPRGVYYVFGPAGAEDVLVDRLKDLGYQVEVSSTQISVGHVAAAFVSGPFSSPTLVFLLLAALLICTGVTSHTKAYAILRLHGASKAAAVAGDVRSLTPAAALAVALVAVVSVVGLGLYNDLHQFGRFLLVAGLIFLAAAVVEAIVYAAVLHLVWDTRLLEGIKGRLGFRVVVPTAYLIRVPGLLVSVAILAGTFASVDAAADAGRARDDLDAAGTAAKVFFEGRVPSEEADRLAHESGAWLKGEDAAGRTLLALPRAFDDMPGSDPDFLVVNRTYLSRNSVLDSGGDRVLDAPRGTVLILVPDDASASAIQVEAYLREMGAMAEDPTLAYEVRTILPAQSYFLYEPRPDAFHPDRLSGIPLAVVNPDTNLLRDDDYMAYASQGRILVTDPETAAANTPPAFLGAWISAYVPVAQTAADDLANKLLDLRIRLGTLVVALGVLLATAVGLAQIHVRGNAQEILVRHLHGWTFAATHRRLLRAELVLVVAVVAWSLWTFVSVVYPQLAGSPDQPFTRGVGFAAAAWQPCAVVLVALLNLGLLVATVQARSHSMIRTRSEETA